jgi:hypothetical protein
MSRVCLLAIALNWFVVSIASAQEDPQALVKKVIAAGGGEEKLLKLFRIKEQLNVSSDETKKGFERISVLEPPTYWWVGKKERVKEEKEPATFLVWAWTLQALTDPSTKIEALDGVMENDALTRGLRLSGSITPAMDLHFTAETLRLARIDWRSDIHRLSDWREHDGAHYPAKCIGYKKATGKPWYFSEIKELERLTELPAGLERK